MDIERRQHKRHKLYSPEYFEMGAENGDVIADLSENGLGFQAANRIDAGREATFSFSLGAGYRITARARIAWAGPGGKSGGSTFTALPEDSRSIIHEWLARGAAEQAPQSVTPARESETDLFENEYASRPAPITEDAEERAVRANISSAPMGPHISPEDRSLEPGSVMGPVAPSQEEVRREPLPKIRSEHANTKSAVAISRPNSVMTHAETPPVFPPRDAAAIFSRSPWSSRQDFQDEKRSRKGLLAIIVICLVIVAVIASVPYVRSRRQQIGNAIIRMGRSIVGEPATSVTSQRQIRVQSARPESSSHSRARAATSANAPSTGTKIKTSPATSAPSASSVLPQISSSQPQKLPLPSSVNSSSAAANAVDTGQAEFRQAQRYLNGSGVAADPGEAAQWFWRSLEKGDTAAAIPLADLYLRGNGVSRSCLQARILLTTAARKGNGEAIQKLSQLPENCE